MITTERYTADKLEEWNGFVALAKNGTFLIDRRFMDYHSDRFADFSIMFYDEKNRLVALLPANREGDSVCSHRGLTYGGLVMGDCLRSTTVIEVFEAMNNYLKKEGVREVIYKPTPWIYHSQPSEEDLYALFRCTDFHIVARELSTTVNLRHPLPMMHLRRRHMGKAQKAGVEVNWSDDFKAFWEILDANLLHRYDVHPVHSLNEITLLANKFPDNIRLCLAMCQGEAIAGTVLFITSTTIHVQYISASAKGKDVGALDLLFSFLINYYSDKMSFFDFGKSTEDMGRYLNEGLIFQKEGFGGRGVCYDTYAWEL